MGLTPARRLALATLPPVLVAAAVAGLAGYRMGTAATGGAPTTEGPAAPPGALPAAAAPATDGQLATVEVGFAADMLDHHDQILAIAAFAADHAEADMVRSLAVGIVASQQYEKGLLEAYLRSRGVGRPTHADRRAMAWMGAPISLDQMPGAIPQAEVVSFYGLSGTALDRRFLELTVRHHEGGVHMATAARDRTTDPWLRDLAGQMVVAQQEEIGDARAALG